MSERTRKDRLVDQLWFRVVLAVGLFVAVLGLWFGSAAYISSRYSLPADRGQFGDMFGAINSLFSGLAFAGVIYAIFLQTLELSLQRQELEDTRYELRRAADAQRLSERALSAQVELLALSAHLNSTIALFEKNVREKHAQGIEGRYQEIVETRDRLLRVLDAYKIPVETVTHDRNPVA